MSTQCYVTAWIRHVPSGVAVRILLGEFHAVWDRGVMIGSDPICTIRLFSPDVAPRHAFLFAVSNHKYLEMVSDDSAAEPGGPDRIPPRTSEERARRLSAGRRIDNSTFSVGPFIILLDELYPDKDQSAKNHLVEWFTRPASP
jgi:hypothetical protein